MEPVTLIVTGRSLHQSALQYKPKGRMKNGVWYPIPRSAPPQLLRHRKRTAHSSAASTRSMRVASAHSAMTSQQPQQLSVNDVYKMAERTRMRTSMESRHMMLERTQKMVRNDSGMSRPETGWSRGYSESRGPRVGSTPGHVIIRRTLKENRDSGDDTDNGPGFISNVEISLKPRTASAGARSSGIITSAHHNNRLGSAVTTVSSYVGSELSCASPRSEEPEARKMSVARQCCEVMGPGVCRDCRKLRVRMMDRERMEADFPRLRVSEKNVTTSAILMRILPDMTQAEIQDKIARGEIARDGLMFPRRRRRNSDDSDDDDKENDNKLRHNGLHPAQDDDNDSDGSDDRDSRGTSETFITQAPGIPQIKLPRSASASKMSTNPLYLLAKLKMKMGGEASTPLFFMDLRHMNSKIFQGRVGKSSKAPKEEPGKREGQLNVSGNPTYPAFVSPRKSKRIEEPAYKAFFQPPLLAKHKQISNPSFFAGSDDPYSLPDRLPDVIEFADGKMAITDPSAALRSESSMSFASEDGPQLSGRGEVFKASKGPSEETVHE